MWGRPSWTCYGSGTSCSSDYHCEETDTGFGYCVNCGDGICHAPETCAADADSCANTPVCYAPKCEEGCGQGGALADGTQDTEGNNKCDDSTGCGTPPCECNGGGTCVEKVIEPDEQPSYCTAPHTWTAVYCEQGNEGDCACDDVGTDACSNGYCCEDDDSEYYVDSRAYAGGTIACCISTNACAWNDGTSIWCNIQDPTGDSGFEGDGDSEGTCFDSIDNDCDGDIDCLDEDCNGLQGNSDDNHCEYDTELTCNDGFDNDGNSQTDCNDSECAIPCLGHLECVNFACTHDDSVGEDSCEKVGDPCGNQQPCTLGNACDGGCAEGALSRAPNLLVNPSFEIDTFQGGG
ncbi:MAG: hypothetical protein ABIH34_04465 [Nanoarchaeota archaeon]